jgi:hypothetical protein
MNTPNWSIALETGGERKGTYTARILEDAPAVLGLNVAVGFSDYDAALGWLAERGVAEAPAPETPWQRTDYTVSIYQGAGDAIPDQAEMMAILGDSFDAETPEGFRSFHIEQGETKTEPTEAQEAMRRRVYAALAESGPTSPGPLLFDFAEGVLIEVDELDDADEDSAHEIADSAVPVYTYDRIALFTESVDLACWEPEIPAESPDVQTVAGLVLYDLARAIADTAIAERRERDEAAAELRDERADSFMEEVGSMNLTENAETLLDEVADEYREGEIDPAGFLARLTDLGVRTDNLTALVKEWSKEDSED